MPFNIFQGSSLISNTLAHPTELIRKTEDRQDPKLRRDLEPFFRMGVKNERAEVEIRNFHSDPKRQATILAILTDMTKDGDKAITRLGYEYLSEIIVKTKGEEQKNRLTALLYSNARAHYLQLSNTERSRSNPAKHLSDLELAVLQFAPEKSTFKQGGYSKSLKLNSSQINRQIDTRGLKTTSKAWKFSDLDNMIYAGLLRAGKDMKQVQGRPIKESLRKWTGRLGAVRLANEKEVAQTARKEDALRQLLMTFPQRPQAAGLIAKFGTFRTSVMTDALIAKTLLGMLRDPDQRVVSAGYDHIRNIMGKSDSVKTKLLAHMYNDICNSALRERAEANSIETNLQSLSEFELSVLKSVSPSGVLLNQGGRSKSAASELMKCMQDKTFSASDYLNNRCKSGQLTFDDLLNLATEQRDMANKRVTDNPLYPKVNPDPVPVTRRTNWSAVQKSQKAVEGMLEKILKSKNPSRSTKEPLLLRLHAFGRKEDPSIDKGLVTALVDATASANETKSKLGYAILKNLIEHDRTRGRAMHLLLEDTFHRIDRARREILVDHDGRRNFNVSEIELNNRILRKLPEINLLTLHYYNPENLSQGKMQELKERGEISIPKQFFLDSTKYKEEKNGVSNYPNTVDAIWSFCTGKANLFRKEANKFSSMDLITLKTMLSKMDQAPESSPPAPSISDDTNIEYDNLNTFKNGPLELNINSIINPVDKYNGDIFNIGVMENKFNIVGDGLSIKSTDFVNELSENNEVSNNKKENETIVIERNEVSNKSNLEDNQINNEQNNRDQTTDEINDIVNEE